MRLRLRPRRVRSRRARRPQASRRRDRPNGARATRTPVRGIVTTEYDKRTQSAERGDKTTAAGRGLGRYRVPPSTPRSMDRARVGPPVSSTGPRPLSRARPRRGERRRARAAPTRPRRSNERNAARPRRLRVRHGKRSSLQAFARRLLGTRSGRLAALRPDRGGARSVEEKRRRAARSVQRGPPGLSCATVASVATGRARRRSSPDSASPSGGPRSVPLQQSVPVLARGARRRVSVQAGGRGAGWRGHRTAPGSCPLSVRAARWDSDQPSRGPRVERDGAPQHGWRRLVREDAGVGGTAPGATRRPGRCLPPAASCTAAVARAFDRRRQRAGRRAVRRWRRVR